MVQYSNFDRIREVNTQSFAELLKKFEGRVVYIDFMGSHCKPCIDELKEVKKLESYF